MRHYGHLTLCEREDIMLMRREGRKITETAAAIGRSKSTVSRELARNSCQRFYRASTAQARHEKRREPCRRTAILDDDQLFSLVGGKFLEEQWPPRADRGQARPGAGRQPGERLDHLPRHSGRALRRPHRRQKPQEGIGPGHQGDDKGAAAPVAAHGHPRQGQGVRRARRRHGGPGGGVLLRLPAPPVGEGHQREHQRAAARVLPQGQAVRQD